MTILLVLFVAVVFAGALFLRRANGAKVRLGEIPAILEKVKEAGKDGTFAQFCFETGDMPTEAGAVNVQFSIEGGRVGFDWVLICEVNRRDREKFLALARGLGHAVTEHKSANGCEYLRAEDGDLLRLCLASICELYGLPESAEVDLVWEGIAWP
ncbi:MAG TPA: hypothetical protein VHY09_13390 [Candidatus Methylacidiphilales bacterium]|jgi:hypothetical protein|nr:hypothetical protein [Candidatus Methylacidiphilales bacterium]